MEINEPEIVNALANVAGANSVDIIDELEQESEMDEFSLAERLGMDVKTVRKILYKLYDNRLVKFRRIKDDETGWYIYLWKFENEKLRGLVERIRQDKVRNLHERLDYEKNNQFFMCENGCIRVPFENAMSVEFICPHCGGKLNFADNSRIVEQLEKQLKEIERVISS